MVICPRCETPAEELQSLPAESLVNGAREGSGEAGRACRWCRHEVLEG